MIAFELTMPHAASWNGKWSGEGNRYVKVRYDAAVPKELWNNDYYYRWDDGWEACVSVRKVSTSEARHLSRISAGFCGYEWMIYSILKYGQILSESDIKGEMGGK